MKPELTFDVDFSGLERVMRTTPGRLESFLDAEAESIVNDIKLSFGTSPPGRSYRHGGVVHVASQPGFPPNVDTNSLRGSIRWEKTGRLERKIEDGVKHGVWLELGTADENQQLIAPRPFVGPAFERARRGIGDRVKQFGVANG